MLGVGRLLRELSVSPAGEISLVHGELALSVSPPAFGIMRGHQLTDWGFFMTTEFFEQYVKELLIFGAPILLPSLPPSLPTLSLTTPAIEH
jgi:hypothetical protein